MWFSEGSKIDWTAVAALIALAIWLYDKWQRQRERAASAKLLAQIMVSHIATTQVDLAKFRSTLFPSNGDQSYVLDVRGTEEARKDLASKALLITVDLPSQFLDKADFFAESLNKTLANAYFQVNHLKNMSRLLGDLSDSADENEIDEHLKAVLTLVKEAETVISEAFQTLRQAGRSSI